MDMSNTIGARLNDPQARGVPLAEQPEATRQQIALRNHAKRPKGLWHVEHLGFFAPYANEDIIEGVIKEIAQSGVTGAFNSWISKAAIEWWGQQADLAMALRTCDATVVSRILVVFALQQDALDLPIHAYHWDGQNWQPRPYLEMLYEDDRPLTGKRSDYPNITKTTRDNRRAEIGSILGYIRGKYATEMQRGDYPFGQSDDNNWVNTVSTLLDRERAANRYWWSRFAIKLANRLSGNRSR